MSAASPADRCARPPAGRRARVVAASGAGDVQPVGLGAVDKTGRATQRAGQGWPSASTAPASSQNSSGKNARCASGMAGRTTCGPPPPAVRAGRAGSAGLLAGMKRRHRHAPSAQARKPAAVAGMATKPSKASMRAPARRGCADRRPARHCLPARAQVAAVQRDVGNGHHSPTSQSRCASSASRMTNSAWARAMTSSGLNLAPNTVIRRAAHGRKPVAGGHRQPALHLRRLRRLTRQPVLGAMAAGQIAQNGVGIGHGDVAIANHRHLARNGSSPGISRVLCWPPARSTSTGVTGRPAGTKQLGAVAVARTRQNDTTMYYW